MNLSSFSALNVWPKHNRLAAISSLTNAFVPFTSETQRRRPLETYPYRELAVALESEQRTFWCWFKPRGRACFSLPLLKELRIMQGFIKGSRIDKHASDPGFDYMVVGSQSPGVYNLGGDLMLFNRLVRGKDRASLRRYAELCVDVVRDNATSYGRPIVTIAAVEGSCLGGGFEAALSCDVIIAEQHVKFGFPEILFGLFPGMGAVNFLSRRLSKSEIDELLLSGRTYTAQAMHAMGLVDEVVATGEAQTAARRYIQGHQKRVQPQAAVCEALRCATRFEDREFDRIIDLWVDTALGLSERDLNKMLKLVEAQVRKVQPESSSHKQ
ncbi:MAG: enoyl-CoA hydratase/isomerase family protein [Alphaproteobacteria bacterium]|nr:enoyl-CoA hydratase/isomerase family protein [Alphaproteobacteria bacterium]